MLDKFTKIVATIGPSSSDREIITRMMKAGADVFRLNFSHGDFAIHEKSVKLIREAAKSLNRHVAIFQDLQGPKIRIGKLQKESYQLHEGDSLIITTEEITGDFKRVSIDYPYLHEEAQAGHRILIDDGLIELEVQKVQERDIHCRVMNPGILKPRKGVNLPHIKLKNISSITEKDQADLAFAFSHEIDFVALSFVRQAEDVKELKLLMLQKHGRHLPIISKIEKPEAVDDLENIIEISDAIMVARGDLGVETSAEEVPIIQKTIIRRCNLMGKPVITATQMLESMIQNPRPTRAEAADVANAILDGTSAVMLSGETAAGKYPVEAVEIMARIAKKTESSIMFKRLVFEKRLNREDYRMNLKTRPWEAVGMAAVELAETVNARFIACFTQSGGTARLISKMRPPMHVVGFSPSLATIRQLCLAWGVYPMEIGDVATVDQLLEGAPEALKFKDMVVEDDMLVITAGVPVGSSGKTNMIKVVRI